MTERNSWLILLMLGVCCASTASAQAGPSADSSSGIVDVVITPDGQSCGWLLDGHGQPLQGADVVLRQHGTTISQSETDLSGLFEFSGLSSGVYQLHVGDQACVIRTWDQAAAPPSARKTLTLILGEAVIRGQSGGLASLYPNGRRIAGLSMVGIALGTITLIGIEATENDAIRQPTLGTPVPPAGSPPTDIVSP